MTGGAAELILRRLTAADAEAFRAIRLEAFTLQGREFRSSPADAAAITIEEWAKRLESEFVVGLFEGETLVGVAGLSQWEGAKLAHKAMLWGLYIKAAHRGAGGADKLMTAIVDRAEGWVETILLTVAMHNDPAIRLYERWGFVHFGLEPGSVKMADGSYVDEALMLKKIDG